MLKRGSTGSTFLYEVLMHLRRNHLIFCKSVHYRLRLEQGDIACSIFMRKYNQFLIIHSNSHYLR